MITKLILTIFSFFFNSICSAQHQRSIFKVYKGDLNNDKIPDEIEIEEVKCNGRINDEYNICRIAKIYLGEKDGEISFLSSNHHIVPCPYYCSDDNKDPFRQVKLRRNGFSFISEFLYYPSGLKVTKTVTFKYDKISKKFFLHKIVENNESMVDGELKNKIRIQTVKNFGIIDFDNYY